MACTPFGCRMHGGACAADASPSSGSRAPPPTAPHDGNAASMSAANWAASMLMYRDADETLGVHLGSWRWGKLPMQPQQWCREARSSRRRFRDRRNRLEPVSGWRGRDAGGGCPHCGQPPHEMRACNASRAPIATRHALQSRKSIACCGRSGRRSVPGAPTAPPLPLEISRYAESGMQFSSPS